MSVAMVIFKLAKAAYGVYVSVSYEKGLVPEMSMVGALVHGYLVEFFRRMECQKPLRAEASGVEGFVFGWTTLPKPSTRG